MQAPYMQLRPPGVPQQQQAYPYRPAVCQPPAMPISPGAPAKSPQVLPSDQRVLITYLGSPRSSHRRAYSVLIVVPNAFKQG